MAEQKQNSFNYFVAGGMGGVLVVSVGHPFDTIKVRMQASSLKAPEYTNTFDCFKKILQRESIFGFYKGMAAPLITVAPMNALNYLGYGTGIRFFTTEENGGHLTPRQYFLSGNLSGVTTAILIAPGERIKCLLQVQESSVTKEYSSPLDVIQKLTRQHGVRSVFKGLCATLLRDIPGYGAYYVSYESVKRFLIRTKDSEHGEQQAKLSTMNTIVAGSCAGLSYWMIGLPADVLKTRLQTAPPGTYHGIRSVLAQLLRTEGPRALYRGATPVLLRAAPANAACFVGIEWTLYALDKLQSWGS